MTLLKHALNEKNAEAHYGLGYLRWLQANFGEAQTHYESAHRLAGSSPSYAIGLAGVYAEQGKPEGALNLYGRFEQVYPVAALEAALVYRRQGQLPEAVERLRAALKLLDDKDLMLKPENQLPWQYKTDRDLITLSKLGDKQCYLYLTLAASEYLSGDKPEARQSWQQVQKAGAAAEIRELARYELQRLAAARPEWAGRIKAFLVEFK